MPHSSGTTNFGFNLDNQITNTGFLFDGAGDATASVSPVYSGSTLGYDPEERLTAITGGPGAGYAAGYDGDGLRGYKQASGTIWYYLYDPDGGNGTVPVVESTASTGSPTSASINILNGFSADGWRARLPVSNTQPAIYTYDPSGNTVEERINSSSSPFAGYVCVFDAYGDLLSTLVSSGAVNGSFDPAGFGGEWGYFTDNTILGQDSTAGGGSGIMIPRIYQTLLTQRHYDSYSAKFLARDPIGYGGGLNLYGYADGNPVNEADPSGDGPSWPWWLTQAGWSSWAYKAFVRTTFSPDSVVLGASSQNHSGDVDPSDVDTLSPLTRNPGAAATGFRRDATRVAVGFVATVVLSRAGGGGETDNLAFCQAGASAAFRMDGLFAGKTIGSLASDIRAGRIAVKDVPVGYVVLDGQPLIVNTRSSLALMRAGVPRSSWNLINQSADAKVIAGVRANLAKDGLTAAGTQVLRIRGAGPDASSLR